MIAMPATIRNLLTASERVALRAPNPERLLGRTTPKGERSRIFAAIRYDRLRVVKGYRRSGHVYNEIGQNTWRSITLARSPICRGCGQLIEPGGPVIRFSFQPLTQWYPVDSWLHADTCPNEEDW